MLGDIVFGNVNQKLNKTASLGKTSKSTLLVVKMVRVNFLFLKSTMLIEKKSQQLAGVPYAQQLKNTLNNSF